VSHNSNTQGQLTELRKHPRVAADGEVLISINRPDEGTFTARLMDISPAGFRAAHEYSQLPTGQTVRFKHARGAGKARVVWNRITDIGVETGFFVLPS
jgi:hypothetical protein